MSEIPAGQLIRPLVLSEIRENLDMMTRNWDILYPDSIRSADAECLSRGLEAIVEILPETLPLPCRVRAIHQPYHALLTISVEGREVEIATRILTGATVHDRQWWMYVSEDRDWTDRRGVHNGASYGLEPLPLPTEPGFLQAAGEQINRALDRLMLGDETSAWWYSWAHGQGYVSPPKR